MSRLDREAIHEMVVDTLGGIAPEVDFATLDAASPLRAQVDIDSFDFLNALIRLHELTGVDIPETDYAQLTTLDSMVDYLAGKCGTAMAGGAAGEPIEP